MRGQHREVALQSRCPKTLAAPQSTGAAQLGKHPVEIGHDEIEVRFAPMSRRLGVGPDVRPGVYFPAYFGNSVQAVWPARQNHPRARAETKTRRVWRSAAAVSEMEFRNLQVM
jgi:hypothetical protein